MSTVAPLQALAVKPQPLSNSTHAGLILQRKCACGLPTSSLTGECEECKSKKRLQTKLTIGASNDPLEQEADRIADQVLAAPTNPAVRIAPIRVQRFTGQATGSTDTAPASVDQILARPGRPMERGLRQDMEQRFGHDFSRVRVHSGGAAEQSAREVNANAYTIGHDVVFGAGRFAPGSQEGRRLIAHELTHVVQQSGIDGKCVSQSNEKRSFSLISRGTIQRQVTEDEDMDDRHRISVTTESHTSILRRQDRDIPPPPPAYPHFSQILLGEVSDKISDSEFTCDDLRERAFFIYWNANTKTAYPGDIVIGDPAPKNCSEAPSAPLGPMPPDRGDILVAGFFHNHPPRPGCTAMPVGPTKTDTDTASQLKLPGFVEDFATPGPNTTCKGKPRTTFIFGPPRRQI